MPTTRWTPEVIKAGIERFVQENNRPPTARDFDLSSYLPTSRQVQRAYGGMSKLRAKLGYSELDYTKGPQRSAIATQAGIRGVEAEEALEVILIEHFGEPFVHSQKRYIRGGKSRYDFYVYAYQYSFGIDVFTTDRQEYIDTNIRHKIKKYAETSLKIPIYFVLAGESFDDEDLTQAREVLLRDKFPNMHLITLADFIAYIQTLQPLLPPAGIKHIDVE